MGFNFVHFHIMCSLLASLEEVAGETEEAARTRAEGNLRLLTMTDAEIKILARLLVIPGESAIEMESVILARIDELKDTASKWIPDLWRVQGKG